MYQARPLSKMAIEEGIMAAELCCINIIAALKQGTNGNWDQLHNFVKLGGFVNSRDDFTDHPKIINGASDLIVSIFGVRISRTDCGIDAFLEEANP